MTERAAQYRLQLSVLGRTAIPSVLPLSACGRTAIPHCTTPYTETIMSDDSDYVPDLGNGAPVANRLPAEYVNHLRPPSDVVPAPGTALALCPHNIDMSTQRGKALMLKAGSPGELEVKDDKPLRMLAVSYLIMPDSQIDDKTGELKEFVRCVFFDAAGRHYRTTAAHGPFRIKAMCDLYTDDEWQRGIPLIISVRKSKRGTTYHDIQIELEAL